MTERIVASPATFDELRGLFIEDLRVGQTAVFAKTVTETDIVLFAGITGDQNPVHLNEDFAAGTVFKGRVARGMAESAATPIKPPKWARRVICVMAILPVRFNCGSVKS